MILTGDIPAYFAALSECPNALISYPSFVFHIRNQMTKHDKMATSKLIFTGGDLENLIPSHPSISWPVGSLAPSGNLAVSGAIDPGTFNTFTKR